MAEQTLIAHDDYAGPEPAIVLIHGLSCASDYKPRSNISKDAPSRRSRPPWTRAFHAQRRRVRWQFRYAHGRTRRPDLITALGIRSAIVAGHSMGCRAATEAALRLPKVIKGVALIDGSRFSTGDPDKAAAKMQAAIDANGYANWPEVCSKPCLYPERTP